MKIIELNIGEKDTLAYSKNAYIKNFIEQLQIAPIYLFESVYDSLEVK